MILYFFYGPVDHQELHVLTHSVPTLRSSDLSPPPSPRPAAPPPMSPATPIAIRPKRSPSSGCSRTRPSSNMHPAAAGTRKYWRRCCMKRRSDEHTSELQSLMRISYAVFCLKKKTQQLHQT